MPGVVKTLYLPETMAAWPWPRAINPYYEEVKAASNAWFKSFKPFTPESQRAFDKCDFCSWKLQFINHLHSNLDVRQVA